MVKLNSVSVCEPLHALEKKSQCFSKIIPGVIKSYM